MILTLSASLVVLVILALFYARHLGVKAKEADENEEILEQVDVVKKARDKLRRDPAARKRLRDKYRP